MIRVLLPLALVLAAPAAAQHAGHADTGVHQGHGAHQGHDSAAPTETQSRPGTAQSPPGDKGPARAADAIWGAEAMRASRQALVYHHGGGKIFWFQGDRAELSTSGVGDGYLWDIQGYYGGDIDKFWFKSEGEGRFGDAAEQAELQALWSHAIAPFFDLQAGVRQDVAGPDRTHAVIGVQGLAPYFFELDAALFLSHKGDVTARFEAELDQRLAPRVVLQPRIELNLAAQDVPELGIGAGIDDIELGLRLRYEIRPEFAPYIGVEQVWKTGGSADFARAAGEDPSTTNYVAGVRFWF